jgi:hypothetical protein
MTNEARPWDVFSKTSEKVTEKMKNNRLEICNNCTFFVKKVNICTKCGCQMNLKTSLASAKCPIGKWDSYQIKEEK